MHTLSSFFISFPEFSDGGSPQQVLVQAKLDEAALMIDTTVWGTKATLGHGYLTAHLLASSPMGNTAKLVSSKTGKSTTTYEGHYTRLLRIVAAGYKST